MTWTAEMLELVRDWRLNPNNNESASSLADKLGVTRNAIISKAHRNGWEMADKPGRKRPRTGEFRRHKTSGVDKINYQRRRNAPLPPAIDLPQKPQGEPPSKRLTVMQIENGQCRYIAGDDRLCCGHPTQTGSSYCTYHYRLCHESGA